MAKSIYVGNLPFETTGEELAQLFRTYGSVTHGEVIIDQFSGRSRGFGFVEMSSDDEADQAIKALNGQSQGGRPLIVNETRPQAEPLPLERGGGGRTGGHASKGRGHRSGGDHEAGHRKRDEV